MPFFDLPDFNCTRFILLLFANLTYEFILSVQRVADSLILPSYRRCKSFVLTLPNVAILHTVCPERSMAHGTQTSSRDTPRLCIDLPRLRDALGITKELFL